MATTLFEVVGESQHARTAPPLESTPHRQRLVEAMPRLSKTEGAPVESADQVSHISLPPYYTACPSPFVGEVAVPTRPPSGSASAAPSDGSADIAAFAADVSVGKNDPLYFAHYYSTKVPPGAIVPYILHFTRPGDVVLDAFCGTGMTGVAAQLCAREGDGARRAVLSDLSPAASFIAAGMNAIGTLAEHLDEIEEIVGAVARDHAELLQTAHIGWPRGTTDASERVNDGGRNPNPHPGHIQYVVWSDVFLCSACGRRIVYWDLVFRGPKRRTPKEAPCPGCGSQQSIRTLDRSWTTRFDAELGKLVRQAEQQPVLINYTVSKRRFEKVPDDADIALIDRLEQAAVRPGPPIVTMPDGFNTQQPRQSHGFTHLHHFFTKRNLTLLADFWVRVRELNNREARFLGLFVLTGALQRVCRLNRYMPNHDRHVGPLSGTLYAAPLTAEIPATNYLRSRIADLRRCGRGPRGRGVVVGTQSATDLRNVPDGVVDYIFTDPPFGGNLNYSELNTLVEGWLGVRTDPSREAVVNRVQGKSLADYRRLMLAAFCEYFRVLKPGRWITVEFHNSRNAVWIAIQEALSEAGFVVADVRVLDKKKGTTKQLSYSSTVKQDLAISAYKPRDEMEAGARLRTDSDDSVWDFVRMHLAKLPSPEVRNGTVEAIAERHNYLLFDRMVAFYVQRGVLVPISAAEFYRGLVQRFAERHGQYFLPEQAAEYDRRTADRRVVPAQMELFVRDEESAIRWLRQVLSGQPQSFQELHSQFLRETAGWSKHERPMELSDLLEQNFLSDEAGRWYVPDRSKEADLIRLRERALLREFAEYRKADTTRLTVFRAEAVRAGFRQAWQEKDYATVVAVATKIPDSVLREDPKLLMWFDQAVVRVEGECGG